VLGGALTQATQANVVSIRRLVEARRGHNTTALPHRRNRSPACEHHSTLVAPGRRRAIPTATLVSSFSLLNLECRFRSRTAGSDGVRAWWTRAT